MDSGYISINSQYSDLLFYPIELASALNFFWTVTLSFAVFLRRVYKIEGNRRILNTLQPDLLCTAYVEPAWQIHTRTWNLFLQIRRTYFIFKVNEMLYKLVSGLRVVLETMNKSKSFQKWEFYSWRRQIHLLVFKCILFLLKSFEYSPIIMMDIQIQILYRYSIIYIFSLLVVL